MGFTQKAMSCSELTIARLELSNNLLLPPAFACLVLVCFVSHVTIFFLTVANKLMQSVRAFLKSNKKPFKKMVMEYFSNKVADMHPGNF